MSLDQYFIFLVIAFVLMLSPGPAVILAITNGISHGVKGAIFSIFGHMTGLLCMSAISIAGLGAILAANEMLFDLVKYCGGFYLAYLGLMLLRSNKQRVGVNAQIDSVKSLSRWQLYKRGLIVTSSNPKAIIFVTALLPPFIDLDKAIAPQFSILLGTMVVLQMVVLGGYAFLASKIRNWLNTSGRFAIFNKIMGFTFIGFGLSLALSNHAD